MNNKQYKPIEFFIGKDALDIGKCIQDFYIAFTYNKLKVFQHPRLFIRKSDNKGILRLNFCTYFPVAIPDKFKAELACSKYVEIILSSEDNSEHVSKNAPVSHVLKFPELYDLNSQPSEPTNTEDLVKLSDILEKSPLNQIGVPATDISVPEEENEPIDESIEYSESGSEDFEHCSCQHALEQWLSEHKNFSMHIQKYNDHRLCLITDNVSKVFVICLFETAGEWLADEELFNDEPPLYFSETSHLVSPVFASQAIADYLHCRIGLDVSPFVLLDDAVSIINEEDMSLEWMMSFVTICSCNRDYKCGIIKKFNAYMDELLGSDGNLYTETQIALLTEKFNAMDRYFVDDAMYYALRSLHLDHMLPEKYTTEDIIRVWLIGNYCECIWLGRYLDEESGEFFNLIYNYSNIAIIWEHNNTSVDPFGQVLNIRSKLLESGIESALTPCILYTDEDFEFELEKIKCYDYNTLFRLEKNLFPREMAFEKYPDMSRANVHSLVAFANANFQRDVQKNKEEYDPAYVNVMMDALSCIDSFWNERRLFVYYETKLFNSSIWTIVLQENYKKTTIILKFFHGINIEDSKKEYKKTHKSNSSICVSPRSELKTVVIVPKQIASSFESNYISYGDIFYVGITNFKKLICELLINA